jgi:hypothetical protein
MPRLVIAGLPAIIVLFVVAAGGSAETAETLKQEPPAGALRPGQIVLVDDGSCPAGQIKQVTGGSNLSKGQPVAGGVGRGRTCIQRK